VDAQYEGNNYYSIANSIYLVYMDKKINKYAYILLQCTFGGEYSNKNTIIQTYNRDLQNICRPFFNSLQLYNK
jgi:hypothetical protein